MNERYEAFDDDSIDEDKQYCIEDTERSDSFGVYHFGYCESKEDRDMLLNALERCDNAELICRMENKATFLHEKARTCAYRTLAATLYSAEQGIRECIAALKGEKHE